MRRTVVIVIAAAVVLAVAGAAHAAQSANVAALQVALRAKGLYAGPVDGISGPLTRGAVLRLQRSHGIRPTGKVGLATWLGLVLGTVVKLAIVLAMTGVFAVVLLRPGQ